jgi:hypothetical protein
MADKPPDDGDNVISMKAARERAAREQASRLAARAPQTKPRLPAFLIFLGLLALVVAVKYLTGNQ